jgi:hypothetical protein
MIDRYNYYKNWIKNYSIGKWDVTSHPNTDTNRFYLTPSLSFQIYKGYYEVLFSWLNFDHYFCIQKINN